MYDIQNEDTIRKIDIHGQVYADPDRKEYLGSYLSTSFESLILDSLDEQKIIRLCQLFAQEGYRGPINFDAVRNGDHELEFIFDCNPRMSAVFPNIAVYQFLTRHHLRVDSLVNIGYRGRIIYADLAEKLQELQQNNLLFTKERPKGVLLIPSFARHNGYDVWMINMTYGEMQAFINDGALLSLASSEECDYTGLYF